jgi:hypothetical protein
MCSPPVEYLDRAGGETYLDLGAHEAMRDAVVMRLDLDVIVDADPQIRHSANT